MSYIEDVATILGDIEYSLEVMQRETAEGHAILDELDKLDIPERLTILPPIVMTVKLQRTKDSQYHWKIMKGEWQLGTITIYENVRRGYSILVHVRGGRMYFNNIRIAQIVIKINEILKEQFNLVSVNTSDIFRRNYDTGTE